MVQTISCPCGKIFAAAVEPHCYEDSEWQKDMRKYVKKGCKVELKNPKEWRFEECKCPNMKPIEQKDENQLSIF